MSYQPQTMQLIT